MTTSLPPLESFITDLFSSLSLSTEQPEIEYLAELVASPDLEDEDKLEAIKGILETEGAEESTLDTSASSILDEYNRIQTVPPPPEPEAPDGPPTSAPAPPPPDQSHLDAQRKAWLLKQYSLVEDPNGHASPFASSSHGSSGGPGPGEEERARKSAAAATDPTAKAMLEAEVARIGMKKKQLKKLKEDDILRPNLNKAKVQYIEQQNRQTAKDAAGAKKAKDKADLAKQKADAAQKLLDKQKKAQKVERRG